MVTYLLIKKKGKDVKNVALIRNSIHNCSNDKIAVIFQLLQVIDISVLCLYIALHYFKASTL